MPYVAPNRSRVSSAAGAAGFTLLELMIVILIMGIAAGYGAVAYRGMTEEQKLNSTIREFVGIYRQTRAFAAKERRECELQFNVLDGEYRVLVYPYVDAMGRYVDADGVILDENEVYEHLGQKPWKRLDKGVYLTDIQAPGPGGNETFERDFWLRFRADGTIPHHILHFATDNGLEVSVVVEEITGDVQVMDGYVDIFSPQESDFDNASGVALDG